MRAKKREYMALRRAKAPDAVKAAKARDYYKHRERRAPERKARQQSDAGRERWKTWKTEHHERVMLINAKQRAKRFGLECTLTLADIKIPETCPVLGIPLIIGLTMRGDNSPSLDRFDNSKGYTPDNVRIISFRANIIKRDATLAEIERVAAYMRGEL